MFFNFAKNKYWTYLLLFIGFYIFINADRFSEVWFVSGLVCTFLVFRWRAHALECAIDEFYKRELKEVIRIYDIPRKKPPRPAKKKEKPRSGLEPLLEALQAPVLPLNDLVNPNQPNIDVIFENKLFFEDLKRKRKRRKIKKYPYLGDKEQLGKEFRYLAALLFKYLFVPFCTFILWVCRFIIALSICMFLIPDSSSLFLYNEVCSLLKEKLFTIILLYFPPNMALHVYRFLLIYSTAKPLNYIFLLIKTNFLPSREVYSVHLGKLRVERIISNVLKQYNIVIK
jgi:hypothetical protein